MISAHPPRRREFAQELRCMKPHCSRKWLRERCGERLCWQHWKQHIHRREFGRARGPAVERRAERLRQEAEKAERVKALRERIVKAREEREKRIRT